MFAPRDAREVPLAAMRAVDDDFHRVAFRDTSERDTDDRTVVDGTTVEADTARLHVGGALVQVV